MFWGIATLVLFLMFVTAKGELPTYIGFFTPQPNTSDTTSNAAAIGAAAASSVPFMGGQPAATGLPSQMTVPLASTPMAY